MSGGHVKKSEHVLKLGAPGSEPEQGLFSDEDLGVVMAHKAILRAQGDRREMHITRRDCSYPTDKDGNALVVGSTCNEEVV